MAVIFFLKEKEFLLNCYRWAVHSVHLDFLTAFLAFFFAWLGLNVGNHLKSLLRHTCFVFILPFQDLLKSVNKERLSKITCKTLKLFDKLSGFCFIFVKRWSFQHWSDRRIFNRAPQNWSLTSRDTEINMPSINGLFLTVRTFSLAHLC